MIAEDFVAAMSKSYRAAETRQQNEYTRLCRESLLENLVLLLRAEGGIGKTIGYLTAGMKESVNTRLPVIIATSTKTNRDQIRADYDMIVKFARTIGDPIGDLPFTSHRSPQDYASLERALDIRNRLRRSNAPAVVLRELDAGIELLETPGPNSKLMDEVFPNDIVFGNTVVVPRYNLAVHAYDTLPDYIVNDRTLTIEALTKPGVIVITHVMLAMSYRFRHAIWGDKEGAKVAAVIIDEVDRLTTLDFVSRASLGLWEISKLITSLKKLGFPTESADASMGKLERALSALRSRSNTDHLMLTHDSVGGEKPMKAVINALTSVRSQLDTLGKAFDTKEFNGVHWKSEIEHREVAYGIDHVIGSTIGLTEAYQPTFGSDRLRRTEETEFELFANWTPQGTELRGVTAAPGRLLAWMFYNVPGKPKQRLAPVPVILTTAFLGIEERQFCAQIGLPWILRHPKSQAIPTIRYGSLQFVFFSNLSMPISPNGEPTQQHFDEVSRVILTSYIKGQRMLVLTPGYRDIEEIAKRLQHIGVPLYIHQRGSNITDMRHLLVRKPGILLTVYWEGFNIVEENRADKRRGMVDQLVMSRLPYSQPNPMLSTLFRHLHGAEYTTDSWIYHKQQVEVTRRAYQGFMRLLRGPHDRGTVFICDRRFPPPPVLLDKYPMLRVVPGHGALVNAIPERFRTDPTKFELRKL